MRSDAILNMLSQRRRAIYYHISKKCKLAQRITHGQEKQKTKKFNISDFMDVVVLSEKKKA